MRFSGPDDVREHVRAQERDGNHGECRAAFADLAEVMASHRLLDLGRLGLHASRNHARLVRRGGGRGAAPQRGLMVLKLTVVSDGDEVALLRTWQHAGLAGLTPRVWAWGATRSGWSWTLQQRLPGDVPGMDDGSRHLHRVADAAARLHLPAPDGVPCAVEVVRRRLERVRGADRLGEVAAKVRARLGRLGPARGGTRGRALHGDLAANNVAVGGVGVGVFDPCGLAGPREYDLARYTARSCCGRPFADELASVVYAYRRGGHPVDAEALATLTAAELVEVAQWAGRRQRSGHRRSPRSAEAAVSLAGTLAV